MNRRALNKLSVVAIAVALIFTGTAGAEITDGLVAYWPLEGDFVDATGNGNDGTFMGTNATPSFSSGRFGVGIDLDGVDQFVEIANPSNFNFSGQDFSVAGWFRVDAFTKNWQALIAKGEGNRWRVHRRGGESIMTFNGGNADVPAGTNPPIDDGEFHHFAGVSDLTNGQVLMYIDGVEVSLGPAPTVEDSAMPVMLGENPDARGRTWDGLLDDFAVWDRAITVEEIGFLQTNSVPEPSSAVMSILGLLGLLSLKRRRRAG